MSARPDKQMTVRANVTRIIALVCLVGVSFVSLFNVMILKGEKYQSLASQQQLYDSFISAPRGDIYDCNMNLLATSATDWNVFITPNGLKGLTEEEAEKIRKTIATGLSEILSIKYDDVYEDTKENDYYVVIKKRIGKEAADKIRKFISDNSDLELTKYIGK